MRHAWMTAVGIAALACAPAAAQECAAPSVRLDSAVSAVPDSTAGTARPRSADPGRPPDVQLAASVSAREVRFNTQPRASARVVINGCEVPDAVTETERVNLPRPVQPGATYRDVRAGVQVRAWINVECLPALAAADPGLCAPVQAQTTAGSQMPRAPAAPANPSRR